MCEFCPNDGGYCSVCGATTGRRRMPEPMTPPNKPTPAFWAALAFAAALALAWVVWACWPK